jgi:hypothetical protein
MNRLATYIVIAATVIVSVAVAFVIVRKRKYLVEED